MKKLILAAISVMAVSCAPAPAFAEPTETVTTTSYSTSFLGVTVSCENRRVGLREFTSLCEASGMNYSGPESADFRVGSSHFRLEKGPDGMVKFGCTAVNAISCDPVTVFMLIHAGSKAKSL